MLPRARFLQPLTSGLKTRRHVSTNATARSTKYTRRLAYFALGIGVVYEVDTQLYSSCLTRTFRTFATGALVALDDRPAGVVRGRAPARAGMAGTRQPLQLTTAFDA